MPSSIGVNLRVTGHCSQGSRKYMEDMFSVAYQRTEDERDLEYAFFGIFDGHGGLQAATFAKEHLLDNIVNQKDFWSDKDEEVLRAIREGFLQTHLAMWRQLDDWPKTTGGFSSTSGTTASIAFIRRGKIYIGHVGDSSIALGYQEDDGPWKGTPLTLDHKPENVEETKRIERAGGKVVKKSGISRVVWNRIRSDHIGPVRRSTHVDEIPFLAIARSLGDFWSYNPVRDVFIVSPDPDVTVHAIDVKRHRCLIFGTDGLWNVMSPNAAVQVVQAAESRNEQHLLQQGNETNGDIPHAWVNPSKSLVDRALEEWRNLHPLHADNTSVVTLMLDPPGPPRVQVLLSQRRQQHEILDHSSVSSRSSTTSLVDHTAASGLEYGPSDELTSPGGVAIYTRMCDPAALPTGNFVNLCNSSPCQFSAAPVSLVCLQSNEVSSSSSSSSVSISSTGAAAAVATAETPSIPCVPSTKTINPPVNREKSSLFPHPETDASLKSPGGKRRHSSGITQPVVSTNEKRKRTRSEHDCLSKEQGRDEDLAASDSENDRVSWPPWNTAQKSTSNKLQVNGKKFSGSRSGKSMLPLVPASDENANASSPHTLRSDSSGVPSKWTLRSRNTPTESPARNGKDSKISEGVLHAQAGHLSSVHRPHRRTSWPRTSQPTSMCTRSKGRQSPTCNK